MTDCLPAQFSLGSSDGGFVFMNNGVEAYLRLLSDIVDHIKEHEGIDPLTSSAVEVIGACLYFLNRLSIISRVLAPTKARNTVSSTGPVRASGTTASFSRQCVTHDPRLGPLVLMSG